MYPLGTTAPWPLNQWYIAGFSSEFETSPVARTYLNRRAVLFRDANGEVKALSGICPHRMMPMEHGTVEQDRIVCAYHGLAFDFEGRCVEAPTSKAAPNCSLDKFPVKEVAPLVWIWPGDPLVAEHTPLPPQDSCHIGSEGWLTQCVDYTLLKSRYMLLIDNLFDLSHLGFVHASIVGSGGIALVPPVIENRDDRLIVRRTICDVPPDDYHRYLFPHAGDRMTITLESDQVGVGLINAGGPVFNGPNTDSPILGHQNFIHGFTPETETTTHYWLMMTRDFRQQDDQLSMALAAQDKAVVAQDISVLESIENLFASGSSLPKEISMKSDLGSMRARLKIIKLIRDEEPVAA